jgi:ADP-heptose:LPS heptosyltransferase
MNIVPKENILTIEVKSPYTIFRDTLKFMIESRKKGIDTSINLEMFARYSTILGYLSGAKKRVGFYKFTQEGLYIGNFLTHKVIYNPHIHTANSFLALVDSLSLRSSEIPHPKYQIIDEELETIKLKSDKKSKEDLWKSLCKENTKLKKTDKLVLINPNASKLISIRKWPIESYALLVKKLLQDSRVFIVITGVASEKPDAEFIINRVKSDRIIDFTGKTKLKELIDLYNISHLLITNDSGPAHFASMTDIPIMVFFGPETPELYKPLSKKCTVVYSNFACSPCVSAFNQRLSPCNNNLCLKSIEVEKTYKKAKEILG